MNSIIYVPNRIGTANSAETLWVSKVDEGIWRKAEWVGHASRTGLTESPFLIEKHARLANRASSVNIERLIQQAEEQDARTVIVFSGSHGVGDPGRIVEISFHGMRYLRAAWRVFRETGEMLPDRRSYSRDLWVIWDNIRRSTRIGNCYITLPEAHGLAWSHGEVQYVDDADSTRYIGGAEFTYWVVPGTGRAQFRKGSIVGYWQAEPPQVASEDEFIEMDVGDPNTMS